MIMELEYGEYHKLQTESTMDLVEISVLLKIIDVTAGYKHGSLGEPVGTYIWILRL